MKNKEKKQQTEDVELSEKHLKLRTVLFVVFLVIALACIGYGLYSMMKVEPGWEEVIASSKGMNCGSDFTFFYYCGEDGVSPEKEYRKVSRLYSEVSEKAYTLFDIYEENESCYNLYYLNRHPNEEVPVDKALYDAFRAIEAHGSRYIYLTPAYAEYDALFDSDSDEAASGRDPLKNAPAAELLSGAAGLAGSSGNVNVELLPENKVRLNVSESYKAYAKENGIENFVDFRYIKNAFIIDMIADKMAENDCRHGYIISYDGYTRNLDSRGEEYSFSLYDKKTGSVRVAAVMKYKRPLSAVWLHAYPADPGEAGSFYTYLDGTVVTGYIDPVDGVHKTASPNLVSYSEKYGCAEMLLRLLPVYISESLDSGELNKLAGDSVYSLWFDGDTLMYNEKSAVLSEFYKDDKISYRAEYLNPGSPEN